MMPQRFAKRWPLSAAAWWVARSDCIWLSWAENVTIVEMTDAIGDPVNWRHTVPLVMRMDKTPTLAYKTGLKCTEITASAIKVVDKSGKEQVIEADTVILAVGMQPNSRRRRSAAQLRPGFLSRWRLREAAKDNGSDAGRILYRFRYLVKA